jgi:hypothetical protein
MCIHRLDEGFKSSSYLTETLLDPELGHAYESNKAAFNKAHNVEEDMWTWFEAPDNKLRHARFGAAMDGVNNMISPDTILIGLILLHCSFTSLSHLEISNLQGTPGDSSLGAR